MSGFTSKNQINSSRLKMHLCSLEDKTGKDIESPHSPNYIQCLPGSLQKKNHPHVKKREISH
jgi:hypothetical protein